jgi:hypothetical protein
MVPEKTRVSAISARRRQAVTIPNPSRKRGELEASFTPPLIHEAGAVRYDKSCKAAWPDGEVGFAAMGSKNARRTQSARRRFALVAGLVGIVSSGARTTRARDPKVDLETAAYDGSTTGGWTCGPTGTARYAGIGLNATLSEHGRLDPDGPGFLAIAGAAVEREVVDIDPCCTSRPAAMSGFHARIGGGGHSFGLEAGVLAFQGWPSSDLGAPSWSVWPELKIIGGPPAMHGVLGFGSDLPTTMRRPSILYGGMGGSYEWGGFDVRLGIARAGPALVDDFGTRLDGVARLRIAESISVAPGAAVQFPDMGSKRGWEGSLTLRLGL